MVPQRDAILRLVREHLAPLIRADGGELYLVSIGEKAVRIHLAGGFAGCPGNALVRRGIIDPFFAEALPGLEIEVSSGSLIPDGAELA